MSFLAVARVDDATADSFFRGNSDVGLAGILSKDLLSLLGDVLSFAVDLGDGAPFERLAELARTEIIISSAGGIREHAATSGGIAAKRDDAGILRFAEIIVLHEHATNRRVARVDSAVNVIVANHGLGDAATSERVTARGNAHVVVGVAVHGNVAALAIVAGVNGAVVTVVAVDRSKDTRSTVSLYARANEARVSRRTVDVLFSTLAI